MIRNIFFLLLIIYVITGCGKKEDTMIPKSDKVEIVLDENENKEIVVSDIKKYDEENMKKMAVEALKEYLSTPYNAEGVWTAYEKFYSQNYKNTLKKRRNIKNADEYVMSKPSVDFEFEITIDKVYDVIFEGNKAYIDASSYVYDRVNGTKTKIRQTFIMEYENNRWVIPN